MNPNKKSELMVNLKPEFQKELFTKFLKTYGFKKIHQLLNKPHSTIYHYRNLRVKFIPLKLIKKVARLTNTQKEKLNKNITEIITEEKRKDKHLEHGQKIRKIQLKEFRKAIPQINELIENNELNIERWFKKYLKLINFGSRQFKEININKNKIRLTYTSYTNGKKKKFFNYLPRKIKIDKTFQYFFGLWCGDRAGRGRFGIVNQNKVINLITQKYLEKLYQKPEFMLIHSEEIKPPELDYPIDKVYTRKSLSKKGPIFSYSVSVASKNSILFRFFDYLLNNLEDLLNLLPNKNIFFAGLFDAEGNVFWEDGCFRWSCNDKELIKIYIKKLKELKLFNRFDGQNLVSNNKEKFKTDILPFIKHPDKINKANLLCYNKGNLDKRFLNILKTIKENNGSTNKELAKVLKRVKLYSQLKFLENFGYVYKKDYPHKNHITMKGLKEIQRGQGYV